MKLFPAGLLHLTVSVVCLVASPSRAFVFPTNFVRRVGKGGSSHGSLQRPLQSAAQDETSVTRLASVAANAITSKFPTTVPFQVHKFGGASLANAELYQTVGDLLLAESTATNGSDKIPTMAIVSARAGVTDQLVQVVDSALTQLEAAEKALEEAVQSQIQVLKQLAPPEITEPIEESILQDARDILSVVQSLRLLQSVPAVTMEVVTGFGEIWSAQTLTAYLQTKTECQWIDAREVLVVKSTTQGLGEKGEASTGGVVPLWDETLQRMQDWWNKNYSNGSTQKDTAPMIIVTGFVAKTLDGVPTTLKRSGSDYSATIFAKLVGASRVTMWKNTDGVYTADPRAVPEAFSMASLTYDEAMELAYFGAQVLHPSAMMPCIDENIPVYVRNIFNPAFKGTVIQGRSKTLKEALGDSAVKNWRSKSGEIPIKGITSVDKAALVTLEGASIGGANVVERFMGAMANADITVLIITQASSESSITVAVPENQGKKALQALEDTFELELARSTVGTVSLVTGMSIVAIVGEGMAQTSGVSSTFMTSLARANVNIRLIAQGSSERQVAVVVQRKDASRALRAAHMAFTLSETVASVTLLGARGFVGSALCRQLQAQKETLAIDSGAGISVCVAACSNKTLCCPNSKGLDLTKVGDNLNDDNYEGVDFDLDHITSQIEADVNPLRVVVDCTNSEEVANFYDKWLSKGIFIISSGRKVGAGDMERYCRVMKKARENSVNLYLESSVGNALPIFSTLRDLQETGDNIRTIEGAVSGTMAYVMSTFSDDTPFSEAVRRVMEKDISELDARVDLSGTDTAQKVVILARQAGLDVSIEDVEIENILPHEIMDKNYDGNEDLLKDITKYMDGPMLERYKAAEVDGKRLRYKFSIDMKSGKCKCHLDAVPNTHPLYRLKRQENLVAFDSERYITSPLIVKGAAAGPELTAAGIFADLLRLTRAYSSNQA